MCRYTGRLGIVLTYQFPNLLVRFSIFLRYIVILSGIVLFLGFSSLGSNLVARAQEGELPAPSAPEDDFAITVKTDNPGTSSDTQFRIPTRGSDYNYNVDCDNDGTNEATGQESDYTCSYASPGTYTPNLSSATDLSYMFFRANALGGGTGN